MPQPTPSLYERLVTAGCEIDHHETDLYVRADATSEQVIAEFEAAGGITNKKSFFAQDDGSFWYDLPFQFDPAWKAKKLTAESTEATPEATEREILVILVERYERTVFPIEPSTPLEAIQFRMYQAAMPRPTLPAC